MPEIIGVKFRNGGKVYYFSPGDLEIHYHDHVIVETARGLDYGTVVLPPVEKSDEDVTQPLKPVIRLATKDDEENQAENLEKEKKAYWICKDKIAEHGLEMKLISVEYTFDNSKILFYFTADGRIDFRELVKDLAGIFKTRIELRQIGVRDETKLLGGMGICGRPLCCHSWLTDFQPVSIKMAKDQNLSLNPAKISGVCGRLMCCLKNEADTYAYLNKGLPGKGDYVTTKDGQHGDVQSVNILRRTVKVILELENGEKDLQEFNVDDITFVPKNKRPKCQCPVKEQMALEHAELVAASEELSSPSENENKEEESKGGRPPRSRSQRPPQGQKNKERRPRPERPERNKQKRENRPPHDENEKVSEAAAADPAKKRRRRRPRKRPEGQTENGSSVQAAQATAPSPAPSDGGNGNAS